MLTKETVVRTYREAHGEDITEVNLNAFMRFAANFDCLDCDSWREAQDKILASMDIISEEIQDTDNDEARDVLRSRYAGLLATKGASHEG